MVSIVLSIQLPFRLEKEFAQSQKQLQTELSDKRCLVSNLKQQLDMHQGNVDDLKAELNRAKKRQVKWLSYLVLSCPVQSCPVLSCPVLSCPVLSCPILFCPVLFYLVLFCPSPALSDAYS